MNNCGTATSGLTIRMTAKPFDIRLCYIAGAVRGFSLWICVESMLPTCIVLVVFGLLMLIFCQGMPEDTTSFSRTLKI